MTNEIYYRINQKYRERKVDLAVDGWVFATNCDNTPEEIEKSLHFARHDYLEFVDAVYEALEDLINEREGKKPAHPQIVIGNVKFPRRLMDICEKSTEPIEEPDTEYDATSIETLIENLAYDCTGKILPSCKAIYIKGKGVKLEIPSELVDEARNYLKRNDHDKKNFLLSVYRQIVQGEAGTYYQRFRDLTDEIVPALYYFADKLRGLGLATEAEKLEAKVKFRMDQLKIMPEMSSATS